MHRLTSSLPAYVCHVTRTWSRDTHSTMEESCFQQKFAGDKLVGWEEIPLTDWLQNLPTRCRLANLQGQLLHKNLRDNGEVTRLNLEHQSTGLGDLPRD